MSSTSILVTLAVILLGHVNAQRKPPNYSLDDMPETNFDCSDKVEGGYYADPEADCQMFHVCVRMPGNDVQDYRFLCPNDTMFDQENRICANWFDIDCEAAAVYYGNSFDLYRIGSSGSVDQSLGDVVASPSPIISLGPSTARPLGNNRPRTSGTGYYSNRRNGPRNSFDTNLADDESLVRSATGDRRLQRTDEERQVESEAEVESYDDSPKRRLIPKKKVALRKLSRNRPNENYDGSFTKEENTFQSTSKVYIPTTTPVPTTQRTNYNNFRGSNGFSRNGGNRNNFVSATAEPQANTQQLGNNYQIPNQQHGGNFNFQQKPYQSPSTVSVGTTLGYKAPSPTTTASPSPSSFSSNYQNYQRPPSRPNVAPTSSPDTYQTPTTFSPTTGQSNNYNNFNANGFNRNGNTYDRTNPAPTTYTPPTARQNNFNTFSGNDYQNTNPVPTTYSPATSKSTNYNPYTANFNNNYNAQTTTTTVAPSSSDYSSFRTNNFQRNTFNSYSTIAATTTLPTTTVAPTSRRQPFNSRRTFQSPAPFQLDDEEKESLKTAQSANFGSNDEYLSSNSFRANKAKTNFTSTSAPSSFQTHDRSVSRYQAGNTETTAAYSGRSTYNFALNNNDQANRGFGVTPSTTAAPATRGSSNFRAGNTYTNPISNSPSSQSAPPSTSTRANNGVINRAPITTVPPQNTITNVNTLARGNKPNVPSADKQVPQPQPPAVKGAQKGGEAYDYAYYDDTAPYDYQGFEEEAEAHFGKTNKASKVTPPVPGN